jgi:soluble epoxide hydrolase / lipid-phosphate phosphatase
MLVIKAVWASANALLWGLLAGSASASSGSDCSNGTVKYFTTLDGSRYAYDFHPPQGSNKTLLLLHGFPSSRRDWNNQVAALTAEGFGTLAPDLLGYGASDKPTDPKSYNGKRVAGHLNELIDHAGLDTVIGVAHDVGVAVLSKTLAYHQERFESVAFLSVGYRAPGGLFDIDTINALGISQTGIPPFGYWYFLWRYDAPTILRNHVSAHVYVWEIV